jgi:nitrogen fixation/metabolism regulation signal transduction histidine kinase
MQAQHQANIGQLQAACSSALSHVPLLNGATVGHNPEQPDLQALQRQLQQGMQLLGELRPGMQQLMTGECPSSSSSAAAAARSSRSSIHSSAADLHLHPKGIRDTAALARDLMTVADEECRLLQQLTQQLAELSDLQLYVNSMQVQLQLMNQPDMEDVF